MKLLLLLLAINVEFISCGPFFTRGRPNGRSGMVLEPPAHLVPFEATKAKEYWFEQRLNHFDPTDTRTWKQRYFYNATFHKTGGPVFLQLGGEGQASPRWLQFGQTSLNYAKRYNALNVLLEHRFYGESHPTPDLSTENLQYLTSEQALQDAASFIEYLNKNMSLANSKWVVFGGSYAGSLAAWFREKYPHLVVGAVGSSAPVEAVVNFKEYLGVVTDSLGQKCAQNIKEATDELTQLLSQKSKWEGLQDLFQLCDPFDGTDSRDVSNFVEGLVGNIEGVVQYNDIVANSMDIDDVCDIMANTSMTPLDRYAKVNEEYLKPYNVSCIGYKYMDDIEDMQETSWNSSVADGNRQWMYQTCVEFAFYQSTDLNTQPFGQYFSADFFVQQCADIFGAKYNSQLVENSVDFTNNYYGGRNIKASKIVFPNGSIDPWHALGILRDLGNNLTAAYVNGVAHCADMYADRPTDSHGLKDARVKISNLIGEFLAD